MIKHYLISLLSTECANGLNKVRYLDKLFVKLDDKKLSEENFE